MPLHIFNLQRKEYLWNLYKLQNMTIQTMMIILTMAKYSEKLHEQYDLLFVFIRDCPKIVDK